MCLELGLVDEATTRGIYADRYANADQSMCPSGVFKAVGWLTVVVVVAVVLTLTHRHSTMQSVVAGQASITLEWKKYLGKNKTSK